MNIKWKIKLMVNNAFWVACSSIVIPENSSGCVGAASLVFSILICCFVLSLSFGESEGFVVFGLMAIVLKAPPFEEMDND